MSETTHNSDGTAAPARPTNAVEFWRSVSLRMLPFADAASERLPLSRLLRLSLFQVSVGMALVLLTGALNRVLIVELGAPASLVAIMIALPVCFAPLRALIGHRSDTHHSVLGWKRGPFIWFGSLLQFGGLAILPFSLMVLSGDGVGPIWAGQAAAALAFLMVGAGLHTTQTAGLALATDIAPEATRPRVVALLYVMLLAGMAASGIVFGFLLADFSPLRLIQVIQGAAVVTVALNLAALWRQETRNPDRLAPPPETKSFRESWRGFTKTPGATRLLVAVALGAAAFGMQDVLLEPYGGEVLLLSVAETTRLTALFAVGAIAGFGLAARRLTRGAEPHRLAAHGALVGVFAFTAVIFSAPLTAPALFQAGVFLIGFGGGLFSVCTLTALMALARPGEAGVAVGAWGAAQATAAGAAIALGGALRDAVSAVALSGAFGPAFATPAAGYGFVYHIEIALLFATVIAIGPLARHRHTPPTDEESRFGIAAFPNS